MQEAMLGTVAVLSMLWLVTCSGSEADLPPEYRAVDVPRERLSSAEAIQRGRGLYMEHCGLCHGERGTGDGLRHRALSERPPDFTAPDWRESISARRIFYVIREGRRGSSMPAWKILSRWQTWDLAAYLLSLSRGNQP